MMWPARAAIRPAPAHAVVPQTAIEEVEADFSRAHDLESRVDRAFVDLDESQPALARYLAREVDQVADETAQALGHFLGVAVHEAFTTAFGSRVRTVDDAGLEVADASFECDEELRRDAPDELLESDDVVAISQPHLMSFVRQQMDAALEADEDGDPADVDLEAVARIYRAVMVEIMALSSSVAPPNGITTAVMLA